MDQSLEQSFWARVDKDGPLQAHMDTPCWAWIGSKTNGYGSVPNEKAGRRKWIYAHRFSYELHLGKPKNLVCHRCNNRECTNPEHLYDGTYSDNTKDAVAAGAVMGTRLVTPELRLLMRADKEAGLTYRDIGRKYGFSDVTARNWLTGKYCDNS